MNAKEVAAFKPRDRVYKRADYGGLYLEIHPKGRKHPNGRKTWRFRYHRNGSDTYLALGDYPKVSLQRARELRDVERDILDSGEDPARVREQRALRERHGSTFKEIAEAYLDERIAATRRSGADTRAKFKRWVYPEIGDIPIRDVKNSDLLRVLDWVEFNGKHETARRIRGALSKIFRRQVARGMIERDPTPDVDGMADRVVNHYPVMTDPVKVGGLLRAIDSYEGEPITRLGLKLLMMLMCRPGELRTLRWDEVYEDEIRLDESRTKTCVIHIIPLSSQAKVALDELRGLTGDGTYCFPGTRSPDRCMSDNTLNAALRRMGFTKEEIVAHSFRKIASSRLHELGFNSLHVEKQLGHADGNKIRAIYNHADYLDARRKMMQAWADDLALLAKT